MARRAGPASQVPQAGLVRAGGPAARHRRLAEHVRRPRVPPTVAGYAEHAFTTDVDLIREPFPTHVPIPDDVEHVYTLTTGVSPGVYVTVTSVDLATGISHHRAGTDNLAELHLEAAALWEQLGEQMTAALREHPDAAPAVPVPPPRHHPGRRPAPGARPRLLPRLNFHPPQVSSFARPAGLTP